MPEKINNSLTLTRKMKIKIVIGTKLNLFSMNENKYHNSVRN